MSIQVVREGLALKQNFKYINVPFQKVTKCCIAPFHENNVPFFYVINCRNTVKPHSISRQIHNVTNVLIDLLKRPEQSE